MADLPDTAAWDRIAKAGDRAVRKAITPAVMRAAKREAGPYAALAVGMGALVAVGNLLRVVTMGGDQRVVEEMTAAYLRGALRGADEPLNADGTPYTGARLDA
jgi:hypothetical protein